MRLRRWDGCIGVAHLCRRDGAHFQNYVRLDAKEGRRPQAQIRQLAHLDRTHVRGYALGDGRIYGVFCHVTPGAQIIVVAHLACQGTELLFHLVGSLPGPDNNLADPAHGLTVRGDNGKGAQIVQDVFRCDGLLANAAFGECHILGDVGVQMVADHQHVQMLIDCVAGVRTGWIGGRGDHVGLATDLDDVGGMAAAGAFRVEGMNGTALESLDGVLYEAAFVQGVGMDHHLYVHLVRYRQTAIDRRRRGAPILVQFKAAGAGFDLFHQGPGQ